MQAIRKFERIQNNKVIINLPENFMAQEVEVIILAMEPEKIEKKEPLSDLLLKEIGRASCRERV